jgi:type IV pilus assembly protein PilW
MTMHPISTPTFGAARRARGFSLTELMVAMALGLVLALAVSSVYLFAKSAFKRQDELASVQQNVRTAFEYLTSDARMVGHLGCYTGNTVPPSTSLATGAIATNYGLGIEGYEYNNTSNAYTMASNYPANVTTDTSWKTNSGAGGIQTIPVATIDSDGLTPGSDVLVIRTIVGRPMRLTGNLAAAATSVPIENVTGGKCDNGTTDKVSGFCPTSHGLIASCTDARTFRLTATASTGTLTLSGNSGSKAFAAATTEVFPLQTIVYYLKRSSSGTTTSMWRRTFNGDTPAAGREQELIEGVDSMQMRYGIDTTTPDADGVIDSYVTAENVPDWSRVVAVRMSVLMHAAEPPAKDVSVAASGLVNDVTVTYPTSGSPVSYTHLRAHETM